MTNINRGKQFENVIKQAFLEVDGVSIDRLHDQTNGFANSSNICDFIVYREPYEYYIECKTVHGNTLPFHNISETQWNGMLEKSRIQGVHAGVICWWVDKDFTAYLPIELLVNLSNNPERKSIHYEHIKNYNNSDFIIKQLQPIELKGKKKKVFFDYDMIEFFKEIER